MKNSSSDYLNFFCFFFILKGAQCFETEIHDLFLRFKFFFSIQKYPGPEGGVSGGRFRGAAVNLATSGKKKLFFGFDTCHPMHVEH